MKLTTVLVAILLVTLTPRAGAEGTTTESKEFVTLHEGLWLTPHELKESPQSVPFAMGPVKSPKQICRVQVGRVTIPGWRTSTGSCIFGFGNHTFYKTVNYEVLIAPEHSARLQYLFESGSDGSHCDAPLVGGLAPNGESFLICIAEYYYPKTKGRYTYMGRFQPSVGVCYIPFSDWENTFVDYKILCKLEHGKQN